MTFEKGDKGSIVDLTFVSPCLVSDNSAWVVTNTFHLTGHRLIYWEVSINRAERMRQAERTNVLGWKTSAVDRKLFRVALEKRPINAKDATEEVEEVIRQIIKACNSTMSRKHHGNRSVYRWNDTIAALHRECIRTRRKAKRNRREPNYT